MAGSNKIHRIQLVALRKELPADRRAAAPGVKSPTPAAAAIRKKRYWI
jgi:hypothetical protein